MADTSSRATAPPELIAYVGTTLLALVPVWCTAVFPSQDGGSHLYNAHILATYASDRGAHYAATYALNLTALANWADHLLLAMLIALMQPSTAEKVLVSFYVLAFSAAARYAVASVRPDQPWLAHLALPLIFTFSVHMGFYNFILCFPLYFVLLGFYWRHRDGHRTRSLAALLLALYLLHPLAWLFGIMSLTIVILAGARGIHVHGHTSPAATARRLARLWLAASPGAVLLLILLGNEPVTKAEWQPFRASLRQIFLGGPLWTFGPADTALGGILITLLIAVTAYAWHTRTKGNAATALAWTTAAYMVMLVLMPWQWKSLGLITERIGTFALLTWVLALAGQTYSPRARRLTIVAAQVLALVLIARWTMVIRTLSPYVQEYLSLAPHLADSRRVLELNFATRGRGPTGRRLVHPVAPFAHTIGLIGAARNAIIVNDYEAMTAVFPLKHRSDAAAALLEGSLHDPPSIRLDDIERYEQQTCQPIDYIVVWQPDPGDPRTREVLKDLEENYALTYVSEPAGHAQLHVRHAPLPCA